MCTRVDVRCVLRTYIIYEIAVDTAFAGTYLLHAMLHFRRALQTGTCSTSSLEKRREEEEEEKSDDNIHTYRSTNPRASIALAVGRSNPSAIPMYSWRLPLKVPTVVNMK